LTPRGEWGGSTDLILGKYPDKKKTLDVLDIAKVKCLKAAESGLSTGSEKAWGAASQRYGVCGDIVA